MTDNSSRTDSLAVDSAKALSQNASTVWVLLNAINVLAMQIGFALLEAGSVRKWHVKSILMKNMMDTAIGGIAWWICGYAIFTGESNQVVSNDVEKFESFFISYCFAITAGTIASGAVAGRLKFRVYLLLAFITIGVTYALVSHWAWGGGFLSESFVDYAGGVVVHGVGGTVAIVVAWLSGPRPGRFARTSDVLSLSAVSTSSTGAAVSAVPIPGSNPVLQAMGSLMLYCAWFSFNAVSAGSATAEDLQLSKRAVMNTLIASCFSTVSGLCVIYLRTGVFDLATTANSMLAGLVSVTAGCAFIDTWAAALVGALSAPFFIALEAFVLQKLHIDDPLSASSLHGGIGLLSGLVTGAFDNSRGLVSSNSDKWSFMWGQCWGSCVILAFSAAFSLALLLPLHWLLKCKNKRAKEQGAGGGLSHSENDQLLGLDFIYHDADYEKRQDLCRTEVQFYNLRKAALARAYAVMDKKLQRDRAAARKLERPASAATVPIPIQDNGESVASAKLANEGSMNDIFNVSGLPPDFDLENGGSDSEDLDERDLELVSPPGSDADEAPWVAGAVTCA